MDRREFLQDVALGAAAVSVGLAAGRASAQPAQTGETREGDMLYRTLGKTGEKVSAIGLGGYHIGVQQDEQDSIRIVRSAIDRGITFMDNCWDYHNGGSEIRMGKALQDGYRDKVFLMSKIDGRTRDSATKQLEESLQRLQTDRIDLMQIHEVIRVEDADRMFNDGAIAALQEAQKAGKIRYIGFTGHKDPFIHLRTLDVAEQNGFRFDAVQMPINVLDAHFRSFEKDVLPRLVENQIGVLGMKPFASGAVLKTNAVEPVQCLHYALSRPTSVVITGMESMELLEQALQAVRDYKPLTEEQVASLLARTAPHAAKGEFELFKISTMFDATTRHPEWMG
jgi:aryl-alcohol dehydrogenase-like predicted oxidoreductase